MLTAGELQQLPRTGGHVKVFVGNPEISDELVAVALQSKNGRDMDACLTPQEVDDLIVMLEYYKREALNNGG